MDDNVFYMYKNLLGYGYGFMIGYDRVVCCVDGKPTGWYLATSFAQFVRKYYVKL